MKNARVQQNNIIKLLVFILVSAASAILSVFFRYEQCLLNIMGAIVVVLSIVLLYKNRKCQPLAIMYLFIGYMNYSVVAGVYWNPEIRPNESLYEQIRDQEVYGIGMIMMLGFMLILYIEDTIHPHRLCIHVIEKKENVYLELICTVAFLWIYFTQIDFNTGGRAAGNALSEYRYIAMLFAWSYAPKTKLRRLIWVIIIGTTTIITFAFGNRADAIISAVLLIILWFPKFSFSKLLPFVPAVIILFKMIAGMRNNLRITLEGILKAVQISAGEWYTTDTYTYAYLPGLLTILLKKSSVLSQRINLLVKNIVYIFIGGKIWELYTCKLFETVLRALLWLFCSSIFLLLVWRARNHYTCGFNNWTFKTLRKGTLFSRISNCMCLCGYRAKVVWIWVYATSKNGFYHYSCMVCNENRR